MFVAMWDMFSFLSSGFSLNSATHMICLQGGPKVKDQKLYPTYES